MLFSPEAVKDISQKISKSLIDTFRLMFAIDVHYLPTPLTSLQAHQVHAHIIVKGDDINAALTVAVNRAVLDKIINTVEHASPEHYDEAAADIVREICNIIGNQLRAYMTETMRKETTLSLPVDGPFSAAANKDVFLLYFKIDAAESISVGLKTDET